MKTVLIHETQKKENPPQVKNKDQLFLMPVLFCDSRQSYIFPSGLYYFYLLFHQMSVIKLEVADLIGDPKKTASLIGSSVTVETTTLKKDKVTTTSGHMYSVDPVKGSVVVINLETRNAHVIFPEFIKSIVFNEEDKISVETMDSLLSQESSTDKLT